MADCFSLPNAAEILKNIRWMYADEYWVQRAADAIEQLAQENEKLKAEIDTYDNTLEKVYADLKRTKAELDATVADLEKTGSCLSCVHCYQNDQNFLYCDCLDECALGTESKWEWRGVQEEEDAEE